MAQCPAHVPLHAARGTRRLPRTLLATHKQTHGRLRGMAHTCARTGPLSLEASNVCVCTSLCSRTARATPAPHVRARRSVLENSTRNASTMSVKMLTKGMKKGGAATGSVIRTQVPFIKATRPARAHARTHA